MAAYIVFTREKMRDPAEYETYRGMVGAAMAGHKFKPLVAYGRHETIEGAPIDGAVVLQFETFEAAKAWYDSPAYAAARRHRHLGADYRAFIVEGV